MFTIQHGNHVYDTVIERKDVGDSPSSRGIGGTLAPLARMAQVDLAGPEAPEALGGAVATSACRSCMWCRRFTRDTIDLLSEGMIRSGVGLGAPGVGGGAKRHGHTLP